MGNVREERDRGLHCTLSFCDFREQNKGISSFRLLRYAPVLPAAWGSFLSRM